MQTSQEQNLVTQYYNLNLLLFHVFFHYKYSYLIIIMDVECTVNGRFVAMASK